MVNFPSGYFLFKYKSICIVNKKVKIRASYRAVYTLKQACNGGAEMSVHGDSSGLRPNSPERS